MPLENDESQIAKGDRNRSCIITQKELKFSGESSAVVVGHGVPETINNVIADTEVRSILQHKTGHKLYTWAVRRTAFQ